MSLPRREHSHEMVTFVDVVTRSVNDCSSGRVFSGAAQPPGDKHNLMVAFRCQRYLLHHVLVRSNRFIFDPEMAMIPRSLPELV